MAVICVIVILTMPTYHCVKDNNQSWGFMSDSTARAILGEVLSIVSFWESNPYRGDTWLLDAKPANPLGH